MIVAPYILSKIQRQFFSSDSALGSQTPLQVAPKPLQSINMVTTSFRKIPFSMINRAMDIILRGNPGIRFPSIRINHRSMPHPSRNQGQQGLRLHVRNHLRPHLSSPAQDPKYRGLRRSSPPFYRFSPLTLPFILPLTAKICLVDFYRSTEHFRNIVQHYCSCFGQRSQNSFSLNPCFLGNLLARMAMKKGNQNSPPLRSRKLKGQSTWFPLVLAPGTSNLIPSNSIAFSARTPRTLMSFRHATILTFPVAKLGLYPSSILSVGKTY